MTLVDGLNEAQRNSVTAGDGALVLTAGAGTGKTRVIIERVAHLVERAVDPVDPDDILLVTFTKKAAMEMFERLATRFGARQALVGRITGGTFHSVCFRLLREEDPDLETVPDWKQRSTIKGLIGSKSKMWPQAIDWFDAELSEVLHLLSLARNERMAPEDLERMWRKGPSEDPPKEFRGIDLRRLAKVWRLYEDWKEEHNVVDFDDMLIRVLERLEHDDAWRARIQSRWTHVLVDETQDTNRVQWDLLKLFAAPQNNITAVGDVRQSIYGWRGARPEQVLAFDEHFPGARRLGLTENYRSDAHVIELANRIARAMPEEHEDLVPTRPAEVGPVIRHFDTPEDEARFLVNEVKAELAVGELPDYFAFLYRTNVQSRAVEDACLRAEIPYIVVGSPGFYGRSEIQDMLAYLRAARDRSDRDAAVRVMSRPNRYLGRAFVESVDTYASAHDEVPWIDCMRFAAKQDRQRERVREFHGVLDLIADLPPAQAIRAVRIRTGYDGWLASEEGTESEDSSRIENLNELAVSAERFTTTDELLDFARRQVEAAKSQDPRGRVVLSTIHRAKGLEWPHVYVVGASDGLLPHKRAIESETVAEERRLWYVAATRARDRLTVSWVANWQKQSLDVSRLLVEIGLIERANTETLLEDVR